MIKGLEQRIRIPRLGRIGLGIKKVSQGGKEHPTEVPYFVVPDSLAKLYGARPTALPVRFPFDQPERVLHSIFYVRRQGKTKTRTCDGECFTEIGRGGKDIQGKCPKPDNTYAPCPDKCRASGKLAVVIPKTPLGIWEIQLGGLQRIADVLAELQHFERAIGPLSRFPFTLVREPVEEQYVKDDGSSAWRQGYPVHVRTAYTVEEVMALRGDAPPEPRALSSAIHEEHVVDDDDDDHPGDDSPGAGTEDVATTSAGQGLVDIGTVAASAGGRVHRASQHADPAPPEAALGKIGDDGGVGLFLDEVLELAQSVDVDRKTAEAYLEITRPADQSWAEYLSDRIDWIRESRQTPAGASAVKAAMIAGARGQGRLV